VSPPCDGRRVNAVRGIESEDIAAFPLPLRLQTLSKLNGSATDLSVGVRAGGIRISVDYYRAIPRLAFCEFGRAGRVTFIIRKLLILAFKQKLPKINIWDLYLGVCRFSRHLAGFTGAGNEGIAKSSKPEAQSSQLLVYCICNCEI
jgi:hypothetical protein